MTSAKSFLNGFSSQRVCFFVVLGAYVAPYFWFEHLAAQDYPNHLVISHLWSQYEQSPWIADNFLKATWYQPYTGFFQMVNALVAFFPLVTSFKAVILVHFLLFLGFAAYLWREMGRFSFSGLMFLIPILYCGTMQLGFYPYFVSLPWSLLAAIGFMDLRKPSSTKKKRGLAIILIGTLIALLCHPLGFLFGIALLGALLVSYRPHWKIWAATAVVSFPASLFWFLGREPARLSWRDWIPPTDKIFYFFLSPFSYVSWDIVWVLPVIALAALGILFFRRFPVRKDDIPALRDFKYQGLWLIPALLFCVYLVMPYSAYKSSVFLDLRLTPLLWVFLLPCLPICKQDSKRRSAALGCLLVVNLGFVWQVHRNFNQWTRDTESIAQAIPEDARFMPLLLRRSTQGFRFFPSRFRKATYPAANLVHVGSLIHLKGERLSPFMTFAPHLPWLPVRFRTDRFEQFRIGDVFNYEGILRKTEREPEQIDYLLCIGKPRYYLQKWLKKNNWQLSAAKGELFLYQIKGG